MRLGYMSGALCHLIAEPLGTSCHSMSARLGRTQAGAARTLQHGSLGETISFYFLCSVHYCVASYIFSASHLEILRE